MGILSNIVKKNSVLWCKDCKCDTVIIKNRLYFIPIRVGYAMPKDKEIARYFLNKLVPISSKADIPAGFHAGNAKRYRCPSCGKYTDTVEVFLPVRDMEKYERTYFFKDGELDNLRYF